MDTLAVALGNLDIYGNEAEITRRRLFTTTNPNLEIIQPTDKANPGNNDTAHTTDGSDSLTSRQITDLRLSSQDIHSKIHHVTTSAPEIDHVLAAIQRNPFIKRITDVKIRPMEKLCMSPFDDDLDPTDHMTVFNIAMGRHHFSEEDKDS